MADTECSAACDRNVSHYISRGEQAFINRCDITGQNLMNLTYPSQAYPVRSDVETRPCFQNCTFFQIVRGDPQCPGQTAISFP